MFENVFNGILYFSIFEFDVGFGFVCVFVMDVCMVCVFWCYN